MLELFTLIILILGATISGTFYLLSHKAPVTTGTSQIVGHAFYVSSGLLGEDYNQGIEDEFQIDLISVPAPLPGKSYYAWLLGDRLKNTRENHCQAQEEQVSLGKLSVDHGTIQFLYPGNPQHTNLINCTSRLLITEQNANSMPGHPSTDRHTWRYYAELPQTPDSKQMLNQLSILDHIRRLLYGSSNLLLRGIHTSLDIQFLRNTQRVWELASSAKDAWGSRNDMNFIYSQVVRVLDYLDGKNVNVELSGVPLLVDPKVAMLDLPNTTGSYLARISYQLNQLIVVPSVTPAMRMLVAQLNSTLRNVHTWLENVHQDAKQLVTLTDLRKRPSALLTILDDMQTQANYALVGRIDPSSGEVQGGVAMLHYGIQQLATFDVTPYTSQ